MTRHSARQVVFAAPHRAGTIFVVTSRFYYNRDSRARQFPLCARTGYQAEQTGETALV
jgi:hypothetical protein